MNKYAEVKPPQISEETMKEMAQFFLKTSIPRLIEARRKDKEANHAQ